MSETWGVQGKPNRRPTDSERLEKFERAFGIPHEPEPEPEFVPPESAWDDTSPRKSPMAEYLRRHPEKRPPPKQLLKNMGPQIAPDGTKAGAIVEKLLNQLQGIMEEHARLSEKIAALESQVNPCADRGPNYRLIDQECVELNPKLIPTEAPVAAKTKDSEIVDKILRKGRLFRKDIILDKPWEVVS